jgi:hypothetical protein
MSNLKHVIAGAAGLALVLAISSVQAQEVVRVRGTIEKADGGTLLVKTREGAEVTVKLADKAQVFGVAKAALADIRRPWKSTSSRKPAAAPVKATVPGT